MILHRRGPSDKPDDDAAAALGHGARMHVLGILLLAMSGLGSACLLFAGWRLQRLAVAMRRPAAIRGDAVSILKPLHGAEPALFENLATFLAQDHAGPVQLVCGVQDGDDPAVAVVRRLCAAWPDADIVLVIDPTRHGANAKVGNLVNMQGAAAHDILILSDSDMAVPRDWLARVTAALDAPCVGAVTCLYRGRGDAGGWSRLAALAIDTHFLPSVLLGTGLGLAAPCMGSTIALRRGTLAAIGGLAAFTDRLADDHAIGAAVRAQGLRVAVPPVLTVHGCDDASLSALVRHELRWNRTIAAIDPVGHAGSILLHPLPLALAGAVLAGGGFGLVAIVTALAMRLLLAVQVRRIGGGSDALALVPLRDLLSFGLFIATFFARSVDWRGASFTIAADGRLTTPRDHGI